MQEATIFGRPISVTASAKGHVIYDPQAAETTPPENCLDCSGYEQQIVGGFHIDFDSTSIWSNVYSADVFNNQTGLLPGTFDDVFAFDHTGGELLVDGSPVQQAAATLSLVGLETALQNTDLPLNPQPLAFQFGNLFIEDEQASTILLGVVEPGSLERFEVIDGDINFDELITLEDYELWKANYRSNDTHLGDANRDGTIDSADYTVWRDAFAGSLSAASVLRVPEPPQANGCLLILAASIINRRSAERHASSV